jgi:hypothetical protein
MAQEALAWAKAPDQAPDVGNRLSQELSLLAPAHRGRPGARLGYCLVYACWLLPAQAIRWQADPDRRDRFSPGLRQRRVELGSPRPGAGRGKHLRTFLLASGPGTLCRGSTTAGF